MFLSVPLNFHNFLLHTLKVYQKSFHLKKKVQDSLRNNGDTVR